MDHLLLEDLSKEKGADKPKPVDAAVERPA